MNLSFSQPSEWVEKNFKSDSGDADAITAHSPALMNVSFGLHLEFDFYIPFIPFD